MGSCLQKKKVGEKVEVLFSEQKKRDSYCQGKQSGKEKCPTVSKTVNEDEKSKERYNSLSS